MGLTKTTSDELSMMFNPRIIEFLSRSELVQALPKSQIARPAQPASPKEATDYGIATEPTTQLSRNSQWGLTMPHQQPKRVEDYEYGGNYG